MDDNWRLVNGSELYNMNDDRSQTKNVFGQHPEVVEKLAIGYEKWWQYYGWGCERTLRMHKSRVASENPSRISSHDMLTGKFNGMWHQYGAASAVDR